MLFPKPFVNFFVNFNGHSLIPLLFIFLFFFRFSTANSWRNSVENPSYNEKFYGNFIQIPTVIRLRFNDYKHFSFVLSTMNMGAHMLSKEIYTLLLSRFEEKVLKVDTSQNGFCLSQCLSYCACLSYFEICDR